MHLGHAWNYESIDDHVSIIYHIPVNTACIVVSGCLRHALFTRSPPATETAAVPDGVCFEVVPGIISQRGCKSQPLASLVRKGFFGMHQINSETPESQNHTLTREPRKQSWLLGEEYHLSKANIIHIKRL